jgi:hypothetical protein
MIGLSFCSMIYRLLADGLVAFHLAFIVFVVVGGALALVHRGWAIVHLPCVAWAAWTEFTGTICPLTPWEQALRRAAGDAGYSGGFVDHYIVPIIYPPELTASTQLVLGAFVVTLNIVVYALVFWRSRNARARPARIP